MSFQVKRGETTSAAIDLATLQQWVKSKQVRADDLIYHPTLNKWQLARDTAELAGLFSADTGVSQLNKISWILFFGAIVASALGVPPLGGLMFLGALTMSIIYHIKKKA